MTSTTMDLADAYAAADATEHQSCLYGMPDEFQEAIADKQKARAELHQRIKELERDAARYWHVRIYNCPINMLHREFGEKIDRAMSEAALTKMTEISQELGLP